MALKRTTLLLVLLAGATLATGSTAARRPRVDAILLPGYAVDLNDRGQVAGTLVSAGRDRAYLWERGRVTHLGSLAGPSDPISSDVNDINERGQIVGEAKTSDGYYHAFLWEKGVMRDLGTLGGDYSCAEQINELGQVIGYSITLDGDYHAFFWDDGEMVDLGDCYLYDLNNRGQVVGENDDDWPEPGYVRSGFLWENGRVTGLGADVRPIALNDRGQVVGEVDGRSFLWENGRTTELGGLPGDRVSQARYIDERGRVLVQSGDSNSSWHSSLWENGVMRDLGSLGGRRTWASVMNASGQVVGDTTLATTPTSRAFLWQDGVMLNLYWLRPAHRSIVLRSAREINSRGQILCDAMHRHTRRWESYLVSVR